MIGKPLGKLFPITRVLFCYRNFCSGDIGVFHSDVRRLLREQKRLQETSSKIQTMLVDMQKDNTLTASQKQRVTRDLSVSYFHKL